MPGFEASQWIGFLAPHGTPKAIIQRVAVATRKALESPDVKAALQKAGMDVAEADTPQAFAAFLKSDIAKWQDVVQKAHVKVD